MSLPFKDRREAGRLLAESLTDLRGRDDLIVLGLPRGGVPVAYEIASVLGAPLDAYIVRKLGVPWQEELAMGAIATGNVEVLNSDVIRDARIDRATIDTVAVREQRELARREALYRGGRPPPVLHGRVVILVDDGLATGATMRAAVCAAERSDPRAIVVAVPVAPPPVVTAFERIVDRVACLATPTRFFALGTWYMDFEPTTDAEVQAALAARTVRPSPVREPAPPRS
jgi:predicted phosphoribosyltransferase